MRRREISVSKSKETIENFRTSLVVPVVKNLPANTGDMGSIPGPGRSYMLQGNWASAAQLLQPARLEPVLYSKRSRRNEKPVHHNEEQPPLTTATGVHAQQQRPSTAKNK